MRDTAAMATTVRITPVSQRPRLLSVSSTDSRPAPPSSVPRPTPSVLTQDAYPSREGSFQDTIPSPKGIKLPHTHYMPIRSRSSTAIPTPSPIRPPLARASHSALAASPSLSASRPSDGSRRLEDDPWALPLGNYTFCNSYDASHSAIDSRSGSRQSHLSKSSSRPGSRSVSRKAKARATSDSDGERVGGWFKRLLRR